MRAATAGRDRLQTLRAYGEQSAQDDRFQLVAEWHGEAMPRHTMQATRLLTEVVDGTRQSPCTVAEAVEVAWVAEAANLSLRHHRPISMDHVRSRRATP